MRELPRFSLLTLPHESLGLAEEESTVPSQTQRAQPRSPLEIYLFGLLSVGTWPSFLGFAVVAGVIAWMALFTNTVFLLVGAMLVAPYPSPAMNAALATACGDASLFGRNVVRYAAVIGTGTATAALLSLVFGQSFATDLMVDISFVSAVSVLLPLAAGVAGGLFLSQSERSSLLSAAAAGVLITLALAPPTALLGMASAMGEWEMAKSAAFLILLQIVGINLSGALTFRLYGLGSAETWYNREGKAAHTALLWIGGLVALVALLSWQLTEPPSLTRPWQARQAEATVREVVDDHPQTRVLSTNVRFVPATVHDRPVFVASVTAFASGARSSESALEAELTTQIHSALAGELSEAVALVEVSLLYAATAHLHSTGARYWCVVPFGGSAVLRCTSPRTL